MEGTAKIFQAIDKGDDKDLHKLYDENDIKGDVFDENGMTALMQAAYKGRLEMCEFLITRGSGVNTSCDENGYTPLMMGCLSGKTDIVNLLLNNGADTEKQNSVNKTAGNLASFVGQHECASLISNYLSYDRIQPFVVSQGVNEPRLPKEAAEPLQKLVMSSNPHPVKIVMLIRDSEVLSNPQTLQKVENALHDLSRSCIRDKNDYDEVLALKTFYFATIIKIILDFWKKNEGKKLDLLIKKLLKTDENGFQIMVESTIRKSLQQFPDFDMPLLRNFVTTISPVQIGKDPTAISCLLGMFLGMHATSVRKDICETCYASASPLRCSACKKVCYCSRECQKLHWSVHKKFCSS